MGSWVLSTGSCAGLSASSGSMQLPKISQVKPGCLHKRCAVETPLAVTDQHCCVVGCGTSESRGQLECCISAGALPDVSIVAADGIQWAALVLAWQSPHHPQHSARFSRGADGAALATWLNEACVHRLVQSMDQNPRAAGEQ